MQNLEQFLRLLTGHFDNREQFNQMQKAEKVYPLAEHVNTVCNDKIRDLPADFRGKFLVEESYYETNGKKLRRFKKIREVHTIPLPGERRSLGRRQYKSVYPGYEVPALGTFFRGMSGGI